MHTNNTLSATKQIELAVIRMLKERIAIATANSRRSVEAPEKLVDHVLDQYRLSLHFLSTGLPHREALHHSTDQNWPAFRKHVRLFQGIVAEVIEAGIRSSHFKAQDRVLAADLFTARTKPIWDPAAVAARLQGSEPYSPYEQARRAVNDLT
ncbi:MAG TPA: hypothetical protein VGO04_27750 [Ensifer sp.]|uniref:hypothetical protein n=1 Tax=Ensifer sp. TaxID=1872086 RepID=UPI002E0F0467|nr:hypothetical protein [Ensifer sp.]